MDEARWLAPPTVVVDGLTGRGGGRIKATPEDFEVEELPAYEPAGDGDFAYLWIEKRDVSGSLLPRLVADRLGVDKADVGMAGMKDRRAVTRQWVSVPWRAVEDPSRVEGAVGDGGEVRLLRVARHTNKLKTGHLHGNRFRIVVSGRRLEDDAAVEAAMAAIAADGFTNTFGPQRFSGGRTIAPGLAMLGGGRRKVSGRMKRLAISAVQASFFNHWLAARVADGILREAIAGDVLQKRPSGGVFISEEPATDTARIAAGEIVLTGPLPGSRRSRAMGDAHAREVAVMTALGVEEAAFERFGRLGRGARRPALAWPTRASVQRVARGLELTFDLRPGAYASVVVAHLCGPEVASGPVASVGEGKA